MNEKRAIVVIVFVAFAFLVTSKRYLTWSIRGRNMLYYELLKKDVNLERAKNADKIAAATQRWARPLAMTISILLSLIATQEMA